jgi:hypothetical protein
MKDEPTPLQVQIENLLKEWPLLVLSFSFSLGRILL